MEYVEDRRLPLTPRRPRGPRRRDLVLVLGLRGPRVRRETENPRPLTVVVSGKRKILQPHMTTRGPTTQGPSTKGYGV